MEMNQEPHATGAKGAKVQEICGTELFLFPWRPWRPWREAFGPVRAIAAKPNLNSSDFRGNEADFPVAVRRRIGEVRSASRPRRLQESRRRSMGKAGPTIRFATRANSTVRTRHLKDRGVRPWQEGWRRVLAPRAFTPPILLPQKAARCDGAGAAGFPRQRMSARHRAPGTYCVPLLAFAQERGTPPRAIHEPKRVGERRANCRCPERSEPT